MSNKTNFNGININWKYNGLKVNENWNNQKVYAYTVTISNPTTNARARFRYYEGIANKEGVINWYDAFYCILSDAIAYSDHKNFYDFCDDFGYTSYDRNARAVYDGCKSAYERLLKVLRYNLYDYYNEFMNVYDNNI